MIFRRLAPGEQVLSIKYAVGPLHKPEFDREDVERVAEFFGCDEDWHLIAHFGPLSDNGAHLAQIAGRETLGNDHKVVVRSSRIACSDDPPAVNYDRYQIPTLRRL